MPSIAPSYRLETYQDQRVWLDTLLKRLNQKYWQQVSWISSEGSDVLPPINDMLNGWIHVYARSGANEGHIVSVDWVKQPTRRIDPVRVVPIVTIKTESGLEHALEIANWITRAIYSFKEVT